MMKYNQAGENEASIKKHLKEHKKLLEHLLPYNGNYGHEERINAVKRISSGRQKAL